MGTEDDLSQRYKSSFQEGNSQFVSETATHSGKRIELKQPEATTLGRFPANLIHDGSDEVVRGFPETKSVGAFPKTNRQSFDKTQFWKIEVNRDERINLDSGSAARFFYCAKASKSERNMGCEGLEGEYKSYVKNRRCRLCGYQEVSGSPCKCESPEWEVIEREVITKNNHPTVKPLALMEYLVKLVSREGHTVLDPFAGSGSTLIACKNLKRNYIGIEKEQDYIKIAQARLRAVPERLL